MPFAPGAARHPAELQRPSKVLERLLEDLAGVLVIVTPGLYGGRPAPSVSGSIGEHARSRGRRSGASIA